MENKIKELIKRAKKLSFNAVNRSDLDEAIEYASTGDESWMRKSELIEEYAEVIYNSRAINEYEEYQIVQKIAGMIHAV